MGENKKYASSRLSVDEILAEARTLENNNQGSAPAQNMLETNKGHSAQAKPESIAKMAKNALDEKTSSIPDLSYESKNNDKRKSKRKEKKFSFFKRHKKEVPEIEEDIYYGLQLKSVKDYKKDYNNIEAEKNNTDENESVFSYLFSETGDDTIDDELSKRFDNLHKNRKKKVENINQQSVTNYEDESLKSDAENDNKSNLSKFLNKDPEKPGAPQKTEPPATEPNPESLPRPKPEIEPNPVSKPEIREPAREPIFQPSPPPLTPPSPLQPDTTPTIRCESSGKAVKEPEEAPIVKEELPAKPKIEEPEKPVPYSVKAVSYHAKDDIPTHIIFLDNLDKVIKWAEQSYPPLETETENTVPLPVKDKTETSTNISETKSNEIPPEPISLSPQDTNINNDDEKISEETPEESPPAKKKHFHLFGSEEEDNDLCDNLPGEEDELYDYLRPSDAPSISNSLGSGIRKLYLKFAVTGICFAFLLILCFIKQILNSLPLQIQTALNSKTYLILNIVFLLIASIFCGSAILNGIKGMFKLRANSDSAVALAVTAVLLQNIVMMFSLHSIENGRLHLYSVLAVMALFLNTGGKLSMIKRINKNFHFVAAPDQKQSVQIFDDHNTSLQMAKGCVIDTPVIAYQKKTNFLKHFLRLSYAPDPSDQSAQTSAPIGFIMSLTLCIISLILWKDVFRTITTYAVASCICVPFYSILSINQLINRVCKIASQCGGMVVGYPAIKHFRCVNAVLIDAKDLFPRGTVVLNYIKTFAGQRIDEAIVDATALVNAAGGPLSDMFDQIIKSSNDILPKIKNAVYEESMGVSGWVEEKRVFVGNRNLLKSHGIEPPSRDYEEKYLRGGKKIVYLACGGELVAMFVVTYNSDRRRAQELRRMENNGISLILHTCDPNITPKLISECFGLDVNSMCILPEHLKNVYNSLYSDQKEYSPALIATKGRPTALMRLLTACIRQHSNISISIGLQNIACILGFLLVAIFTCYSGLSQLSPNSLLVYELFWFLIISLVPKLRKP